MSIGFWDKLTHVLKPLSGVTNLFNRTKAGLVPQAPSGNGTTKYLREDGEWVVPPDNDTNNAVTQTISSSDNANYRVLLSGTADDATRTEGARKDADLYYNPSTNTLKADKVNGIAGKVAHNGNDFSNPITFIIDGQGGQATWFWGSNDAKNYRLYNPSNFTVNKANTLTNLGFYTRYDSTITSSAAAGAEICVCTVGHTSGKFLVFFNIRWFAGNVWFHLNDVATGGAICHCVGGSNASGMAVGWLDINSDRWLRVTCDTNLSNTTIAINISLLRLA